MLTAVSMRTCWVLDHPAHVRLLAPFLRAGRSDDVLIATQRHEVERLLEHGDGHIPRRQIHWVELLWGTHVARKRLLAGAQVIDFFVNAMNTVPQFSGL